MLNKLKKLFGDKDRKNLFSNISSLMVLQVVNLVLPLVTMPYLVRTLGADKFGAVMFAQAFVMYFSILTDFGFNLSATRTIAVNKDNWNKVSEIFSSVIIIKSLLFAISLTAGLIIILSFDRFTEDKTLFYFSFLLVFGKSIFPVWFFQGIEKMKNITIFNALAKILFTIGIFIIIKSPEDYIFVPVINSMGFIIAGTAGIFIAINKYKVRFLIPSITEIYSHFKESSHFFLSRISVSIFTISNSFILGMVVSNQAVAYYSIAEKLYSAIQSAYYPITQGLYPYVANKRDVPLFKKIFKYASVFNLLSIILLFFLAPFIIKLLFGDGTEQSIIVFRILLVALLFNVPSMFLGYPFIGALGKLFIANYSVVGGSIVHLLMLSILYLNNQISLINVASTVIITESIVLLVRFIGSIKFKLWNINPINK